MTDSISVFSNYKVRHLIVATLLTFLVGKLMSNFKTAMDKMAEQRIIKKTMVVLSAESQIVSWQDTCNQLLM